ncbi:MAG: FAD-dependent thymidylate synthase [Candidatus Woesearchaeota archaeon]
MNSDKNKDKIYTFPGTYLEKIPEYSNKKIFSFEDLENIAQINPNLKPIHLEETKESLERKTNKLAAALKQTSRIGTFPEYLDGISEEEKERIFENSLGKGHNAAADLITLTISYIAPRIFTLYLTTFEYGVSMLQKSTRRIEHNGYFVPRAFLQEKELTEEYESIIKKIDEDYNLLLRGYNEEQRKKHREDAIYIQPLSLLTTDVLELDLRALWQIFLESGIKSNSKGDKIIDDNTIRDAIFEYTSKTFDLLRDFDIKLVRNWNTNYNILQYYPSGSLFLRDTIFFSKAKSKFSDLEFLLANSENKENFVLDYSSPILNIGEDNIFNKIIETLKTGNLFEKKHILDILKTINFKVVRNMDLSLLHQETRHRSIHKEYEPLHVAAMKALIEIERVEEWLHQYNFKSVLDLNKNNFKKFLKDTNIEFYFRIPREFKLNCDETYSDEKFEKAKIVIDDYFKLMKFWEKLHFITPKTANIVLPHGLKVLVIENIDGYNLIKLSAERLCYTAKKEMQEQTEKLRDAISDKNFNMAQLMQPKCYWLGKCPDAVRDCPKKAF